MRDVRYSPEGRGIIGSPVGWDPEETEGLRRDRRRHNANERDPWPESGAVRRLVEEGLEYPFHTSEPTREENRPPREAATQTNTQNDQQVGPPHPNQERQNTPPPLVQPEDVHPNRRSAIKVASLNIRGGGSQISRPKWQQVNQLMRTDRIGILAIQESHLDEDTITSLHSTFSKRLLILNTGDPDRPTARGGAAIVLNKEVVKKWKDVDTTTIIPGRALIVAIPWNDTVLNIAVVYAPNAPGENADFWTELGDQWRTNGLPHPDIFLGDFNLVEEAIDRIPAHEDLGRAVDSLQNLRRSLGVFDGWRQKYPDRIGTTFAQDATGARSRIDRIYASSDILETSFDWEITPVAIKSDHRMVTMSFESPHSPFIGRGRWSIPPHALQDRKIIQAIEVIGNRHLDRMEKATRGLRNENVNPQTIANDFNLEVTNLIRNELRVKIPKLRNKVKKLQNKLDQCLNDNALSEAEKQTTAAEIDAQIDEIELTLHTKTRDNLAAKHALQSETMSKYWIQVNKQKTPRDTMLRLRAPPAEGDTQDNPNRTMENSSDRMAEAMRRHHEALLNRDLDENITPDQTKEILENLEPTVSPEDKNDMAKYIRVEELREALWGLPTGKAAGLNGIGYEFYTTLAKRHENLEKQEIKSRFHILKLLTLTFNDIEEFGLIPGSTFAKGWMCPLYKKGDKAEPGNYRPITVLNTDYRILTRVLTARLTKVASDLIHPDQAGFMKGRRIDDHTDLVKTLIDRCEATETNGAIVCLDQEKAYDKIRHDFLWASLRKLDLPEHFIKTVQALYNNAETVIILNGVISLPFIVTRGVRQGDPLSCLLFNIAIESLASMLRNSDLEGVSPPGLGKRLIASLFADDTTVYLSKRDSFEALQTILAKWCQVSGAKFNVQKTIIVPIGAQEYREALITTRKLSLDPDEQPIPINVEIATDRKAVRVLGAYIGNKVDDCAVWKPTVEKIEMALNNWHRSKPTFDGKRLIIGMVVGGLTQYLTRVQGMPKEVETKINKIMSTFIWDGASPSINMSTLQLPPDRGGKGFLNLAARNEAIELMKCKAYLQLGPSRPTWATIADNMIASSTSTNLGSGVPPVLGNPFIQSFPVNLSKKSKLPPYIRKMLKVAKKYDVRLDPPLPHPAVAKNLPAWCHIGRDPTTRAMTNTPFAKCLREKHGIITTGDLNEFLDPPYPPGHQGNELCQCGSCVSARAAGCRNPHKCRETAISIERAILPKWKPMTQAEYDRVVDLDVDRLIQDNPNIFDQSMLSSPDMAREMRVFPNQDQPRCGTRAIRPNRNMAAREPPVLRVVIASMARNEGQRNPLTATTAWYGRNDPRNFTINSKTQTAPRLLLESGAILRVALDAPENSKIVIITTTGSDVAHLMTEEVAKYENKGWLGVPHSNVVRTAIAALRGRAGFTEFQDGPTDNAEAEAEEVLAGSRDAHEFDLSDIIPNHFAPNGALVTELTQAQAYRTIRSLENHQMRRATQQNLDLTSQTVASCDTKEPTDATIFNSFKRRDHPAKIKNFLFRVIHDSYKCGGYWRQIPTMADRADCPVCDTEETMGHILFKCAATGQTTVWQLAQTLWERRKLPWRTPSIGDLLGSNLRIFADSKGAPMRAATRLYTILVTESAYTIWKMRCEWKIKNGGDPAKAPPIEMAHNKWTYALNYRFKLDRLMTNQARYGGKALSRNLVDKTWRPVVEGGEHLREDWLLDSGVLVGMGVERPPGRNR